MKLGKLLLPLALFAVIPMAACGPNNGTGDNGNEQKGEEDKVLTITEIKSKVESTFGFTFEYYKDDGDYYYSMETSSGLKEAVEDVVSKISFLKIVQEIKSFEDEYNDISGYDCVLSNKDESVTLYVYSYSSENKNYVDFDLYEEEVKKASKWEDMNIDSYFSYTGTIPGPNDFTKLEFLAEEEYAEIFAYGSKAENYYDVLDKAGFEVDKEEFDEFGITYWAFSSNEEVMIYFYDDDENGGVMIMIMGEGDDYSDYGDFDDYGDYSSYFDF